MSVFPEKSLKIHHSRVARKIFGLTPPRNDLGGGAGGDKNLRGGGKSRMGGNSPFVPPPKPPLILIQD